jgi:hypothetical protein
MVSGGDYKATYTGKKTVCKKLIENFEFEKDK